MSRRQPEFGVVVEKNLMIPVRDGVKLAADLYRPARDGKPAPGRFPALLTRTPYNKDGAGGDGRYYAERGYVVVTNDVRGRYASEGRWRLITDDPEDGFDIVEWIARQDWSDGKVGTFGTSYPGGTQHALAEMNPPHLTAMVPIDAVSNCGVSGMRQGGAFELRFMNWIFQIGAPNSKAALANPALKQALVESGQRIRQHADNLPVRTGLTPLKVVPEYESWLVEAMRSGPESPFWHIKGMSVVDHVGDYADVPVLHITGWYDSWTRQVSMNYQALSNAKKSHPAAGDWALGARKSKLERCGRGRVYQRGRNRLTGVPAELVRPLASRGSERSGRGFTGIALHHGHRRGPPLARGPAPARWLLALRAGMAASPNQADSTLLER